MSQQRDSQVAAGETSHLLRDAWNVASRAERYAAGVKREPGLRLWSKVLEDAGVSSSTRLLEVGAGPGLLAEAAHSLDAEVVAADSALAMLRTASDDLRRSSAVADVVALPFASNSFDAVVARSVLWCLYRPAAAAREIHRVLRPHGLFLAAEPVYQSATEQAALGEAVNGVWTRLGDAVGHERAARMRLAEGALHSAAWSVDTWHLHLERNGYLVRCNSISGMAASGGPDKYVVLTARSGSYA